MLKVCFLYFPHSDVRILCFELFEILIVLPSTPHVLVPLDEAHNLQV